MKQSSQSVRCLERHRTLLSPSLALDTPTPVNVQGPSASLSDHRAKMAPTLKRVFTMRAYIDRDNTINAEGIKGGPSRIILPIRKGFVEGSNIKADILPGSGDWLLVSEIDSGVPNSSLVNHQNLAHTRAPSSLTISLVRHFPKRRTSQRPHTSPVSINRP